MITNNEFLLLRDIYFMKSFPWLFRTESFDTSGKGYSYFYLLIVINTCSLHWVTEFVCAFHFKSSSEKKYNYVCEPFFQIVFIYINSLFSISCQLCTIPTRCTYLEYINTLFTCCTFIYVTKTINMIYMYPHISKIYQ